MKQVNLRELYPDAYKTDFFVEVSEEILETILTFQRNEAAYERQLYRHKAYYSLNCGNGIENAVVYPVPTPEDILEDKQNRTLLYDSVMALPEKQANRIYAHFYLGMTPVEIAKVEGVDPSCVRLSIRKGLKRLAKKMQ